MERQMKSFYLIITSAFLLLSCSVQKIALRQMAPILENSAAALYEEEDLQIAEQALASNLKLIDGLLKSDPQNQTLLLLAAQGYAGYALGFAEDSNPARAKKLYLRGREYALKILRTYDGFAKVENESEEAWSAFLQKLGKKDVPALFWAGFAWSGYINLSLDDPQALGDLPQVQALMRRVEELQPQYFHGAVYVFWGTLYGMKPKIMGGDPQKSKAYFEKNFRLTNKTFLLAYVYAARFYAAKILDEELFNQYLDYVLRSPANTDPSLTMLNRIAQRKARLLLKKKEDFF